MNEYFNNYSLTDAEATAIIKRFEKFIKDKSIIYGKFNEDCAQEIRIKLYEVLTKNR